MIEHDGGGKKREKIRGVFSTQNIARIGTGTTTRKTIQKTYWFVEEREDGMLDSQPLNKSFIPAGSRRTIGMEDLLQKFSPEPEFYVSTVYPKMRELSQTIERGEKHRDKGELFSAELEYSQALAVDEENIKANFGLGMTYLDRGEANRANDIFERLVNLEASFAPEHKHLFNDFGINLRKNKMFDQALEYYKKAESLASRDENLFYNIARAHFEKGEIAACYAYLQKALSINPDFVEGRKFMDFLAEKNLLDADVIDEAMRMASEKVETATFAEPQAYVESVEDGELDANQSPQIIDDGEVL